MFQGTIEIVPRVVGGHDCLPNAHPYVVQIQYSKHLHCGGTLVDLKHLSENNFADDMFHFVLTAAHCFP